MTNQRPGAHPALLSVLLPPLHLTYPDRRPVELPIDDPTDAEARLSFDPKSESRPNLPLASKSTSKPMNPPNAGPALPHTCREHRSMPGQAKTRPESAAQAGTAKQTLPPTSKAPSLQVGPHPIKAHCLSSLFLRIPNPHVLGKVFAFLTLSPFSSSTGISLKPCNSSSFFCTYRVCG